MPAFSGSSMSTTGASDSQAMSAIISALDWPPLNQFKTEGLETNWGFDWGYVDNINDPVGFRIDNAIQQDGTPAKLEYIDFVKCHTAQMGQGAAVGEVSTESSAAIDVRLRAKRK